MNITTLSSDYELNRQIEQDKRSFVQPRDQEDVEELLDDALGYIDYTLQDVGLSDENRELLDIAAHFTSATLQWMKSQSKENNE